MFTIRKKGGEKMRAYLKRLREEQGLTMQEVADRLGISKQYYSLIEGGERQRRMDITLIKGISDVLGVPLEQIVSEESKHSEAAV